MLRKKILRLHGKSIISAILCVHNIFVVGNMQEIDFTEVLQAVFLFTESPQFEL